MAVFLPAILATSALLFALHDWMANHGLNRLETVLLCLIGLMAIWVSLSVTTVLVGLMGLWHRPRDHRIRPKDASPLRVALLMPIYNETPSAVFGNAVAMLEDLARQASCHAFSLFILSDTQDARIAQDEERAFAWLARRAPDGVRVHYRRRKANTDKKVGNLVNWITGWGAAYDAMLVLDADSLMSGAAINRLSNELSADPNTGLIQSFPMLIGADTLFARIQQFSNVAYGFLLAEGLALWSQREGNYWGHNAIIRTRAFAASAGLPYLSGLGGGKALIISHDFVEAGLLRRAGWGVRFLPRVGGSFEETPQTLIDYVLRDRRWCRGNLQHLRLLAARGFHPISRFHLLHGAVAYLLAPAWFTLVLIWALLGKDQEANVIRYFNATNPLFPDWPSLSQTNSLVLLVIIYAMLLTPKILGALLIASSRKSRRIFGGWSAFLGALGTEIAASIAYAPILMVQQTLAVLRAILGRKASWEPQRREATHHSWGQLLWFHWLETFLGTVLAVGLLLGFVSIWLLPIVVSLTLAVPLSALSALNVTQGRSQALRMDSPHTLVEPKIVTHARAERARMTHHLASRSAPPVAAE